MQRPMVIRYKDDEAPSSDREVRKLSGVVTRFSHPGRRKRIGRRFERRIGRPMEITIYI